MKNRDREDQHVIDLLKQMPTVKDDTDKNDLYRSISSQLETRGRKKQRTKKVVPLFATLVAVTILIIMIPTLFNTSNNFQTSEDSADMLRQESGSESIIEELNENNLYMEESADSDEDEGEITKTEPGPESYVLQKADDQSLIVHAAITDDQQQYVIPLSIILPETEDLNTYYNQLESHIKQSGVNEQDYLFEGIEFIIDQANEQVVMDLPEDFSIGHGSTREYIFNRMLTTMFSPYGIEKVTFETEDNEEADLGSLGSFKEMAIEPIGEAFYKLYKSKAKNLLVPIPNYEQFTIHEALNELKNTEESFDVYQTVPDYIEFSTESMDGELVITLSEETTLTNDQENATMIEAILMTAGSYGYDFVRFENITNDQLGIYNIDESIRIPAAVNPIY
ncbi:hypothetical protein QGM71_02855 [Virgibacillus sp. C22-A2]|uniref:Sigma-X negative effector n=1 Tax=Virgibacillus tibetensis TaxID=3042313 RepID=A0ABU6KBY6_9BACI|nr:hypothetical protein [Virgibacillus sp. C22-A2]